MSIEDRRDINKQQQKRYISKNRSSKFRITSRDIKTGDYKGESANGSTVYGEKIYNSKGQPESYKNGIFDGKNVIQPNPNAHKPVGYLNGQIFTFREEEPLVELNKIKYLYSVFEEGIENFYVGGFTRNPIKIGVLENNFEVHLTNLGSRKFSVNVRYPDKFVSIIYGKKVNTITLKPLYDTIFPSNGYGYKGSSFWSRVVFQTRQIVNDNGSVSENGSFIDNDIPKNTVNQLGNPTIGSTLARIRYSRSDYINDKEFIGVIEVPENLFVTFPPSRSDGIANANGSYTQYLTPYFNRQFIYDQQTDGIENTGYIRNSNEYLSVSKLSPDQKSIVVRKKDYERNLIEDGNDYTETTTYYLNVVFNNEEKEIISYTEFFNSETGIITRTEDYEKFLEIYDNIFNSEIIKDNLYSFSEFLDPSEAISQNKSFGESEIITYSLDDLSKVTTKKERYFLPHVKTGFNVYSYSYHP